MSTTISFYAQKGGVGKTTASCITSFLLAKDYKVLSVDFDPQGNMTQMLTQNRQFKGTTVLQALDTMRPTDFIHQINDNHYLLPANKELALLHRIFTPTLLKEMLAIIKDQYDYIIIDLPSLVGLGVTGGLIASDVTVHTQTTDPMSFFTLSDYMEIIDGAEAEFTVKLAGILVTYQDFRAYIDKQIYQTLQTLHGDLLFKSVLPRRTRVKEYALTGITDRTKKDKLVLEPYVNFVKELQQWVIEKL